MKVLVYGNGAREHALAWKLSQSKVVDKLFFVNPNPLMEPLGENIAANDFEELAMKSKAQGISLALIGPEVPLAAGIADIMEAHGIATFGPHKAQAWLESSKARAKEFNFRNNIPCASSVTVDDFEDAKKVISEFKPPYVLKADGLAGGKGVLIVENSDGALVEIKSMLGGKFGTSSKKVVIEEFLDGEELSVICLYDGETLLPMDFVRDHKRLLNDNKGPNTGGMGAYSPVTLPEREKKGVFEVLREISHSLKKEGIRYHGVLYIGMMITKDGPKVLEYNVRFGDPETQALMVRLKNDFGKVLESVMKERLNGVKLRWGENSNALVIASQGYPRSPQKGIEVSNVEELASSINVTVFGGAIAKKEGKLVSDGGRVLTVVATGRDAHERTLAFAKRLKFDAKFYRTDICG